MEGRGERVGALVQLHFHCVFVSGLVWERQAISELCNESNRRSECQIIAYPQHLCIAQKEWGLEPSMFFNFEQFALLCNLIALRCGYPSKLVASNNKQKLRSKRSAKHDRSQKNTRSFARALYNLWSYRE